MKLLIWLILVTVSCLFAQGPRFDCPNGWELNEKGYCIPIIVHKVDTTNSDSDSTYYNNSDHFEQSYDESSIKTNYNRFIFGMSLGNYYGSFGIDVNIGLNIGVTNSIGIISMINFGVGETCVDDGYYEYDVDVQYWSKKGDKGYKDCISIAGGGIKGGLSFTTLTSTIAMYSGIQTNRVDSLIQNKDSILGNYVTEDNPLPETDGYVSIPIGFIVIPSNEHYVGFLMEFRTDKSFFMGIIGFGGRLL